MLTSATEVNYIAFGFMASKALFAGLHIDLFTQLSNEAMDIKGLSEKLDIPINRLTILLTALESIGLVFSDKDLFYNSNSAEVFLNRNSKLEFIDYLRYQIDKQMYPFLNQLNDSIDGKSNSKSIESYQHWMSNPEQAKLYSEAQHIGSLVPGDAIAKLVDLSDKKYLLDVGGGTGAITIKLIEKNPHIYSTIIDFPNVAEIGWDYISKEDMMEKVRYIPGNALKIKWPKNQDCILMSYLLSGVPGDRISKLLIKAFSSLNLKGKIIIHDFILVEQNTKTPLPALWQLQHMAFTPEAQSITKDWIQKTLIKSGFSVIKVVPAIPSLTYLIEAEKIDNKLEASK